LGLSPHSFGEIDTKDPAFAANRFRQLHQAVPSSETDLKDALTGRNGKLVESGLTYGPLGMFGQQIVDTADLVVEGSSFLLGLEDRMR
jgi:hypothetical protein